MLGSRAASKKGFQGCLANVVLNDRLLDITGSARLSSYGLVAKECKRKKIFNYSCVIPKGLLALIHS